MPEPKDLLKKNILVSNPGKQYTNHLLYSLHKYKMNYTFLTSFWYKPERFPFKGIGIFPQKLRSRIEIELRKRYDARLDDHRIVQLPWFEILRELSDKLFTNRFAERMLFFRDRIHDRIVGLKLKKLKPEIVIGYEESCLHTFRSAKKYGAITILDLAQIHYKEIAIISEKYPAFKELYKNTKLRKKINAIKEGELALADFIICLSDFAEKSLIKHGIPKEKIVVANLGIDPTCFHAKKTYSTGGKMKIIFVGTMTKRKGIDMLLKISDELSDRIDLILIGPMADTQDLFEQYQGKYTWYPYVEHGHLNGLLHDSDVFVFPSYLDSWAMVVVEAMASGLPVIVSENTGAKDAVTASTGFRIASGDINGLKEKIMYFCQNRQEVALKGANASKEALNYTWNNYYTTIYSFLKNIHEQD